MVSEPSGFNRLKVKKGSDSENKSFLSKLEPVNSKVMVSLSPVCSSAYTLTEMTKNIHFGLNFNHLNRTAQSGNFRIFLSFRFYVKSILSTI